jgi:hypothetical protein
VTSANGNRFAQTLRVFLACLLRLFLCLEGFRQRRELKNEVFVEQPLFNYFGHTRFMVGFYRFDEGQRESIRRIISAAKSMLSRNAISRAGDGLPSNAVTFLHAKIAAMTPRVRLRPSSISFSIGVLRKNLR